MMTDIKTTDLPGDLAEIADLIGINLAIKISCELGGGVIFWHRWSDVGWSEEVIRLVDCIGIDNARKLIQYFGGSPARIPKCDRLRRIARDREIMARIKAGENILRVAREFHLTDRRIWQIKQAMTKEIATSDL